MNLEQVMKAFDYMIEGGSEHLWNSYPDARYIDFSNNKFNAYGTLLHSTVNHVVYEASVHAEDEKGNVLGPYRWRNPDFIEINDNEYAKRGIDGNLAWDDQKWIDLEVEDDFLQKVTAIFRGEKFDTRVQVPVDLEDELMMKLMLEAHRRDITLNHLVTAILEEMIDRRKKEKAEEDLVEHSKYWYDTERNK